MEKLNTPKIYTPKLEEFEKAVKSAKKKFEELPYWLREKYTSE